MSIKWLHGFKSQLVSNLDSNSLVLRISNSGIAYLNNYLNPGDIVYFTIKNNNWNRQYEVVKYTHQRLNSSCDGMIIERDQIGTGKFNYPHTSTFIESDYNPALKANQ